MRRLLEAEVCIQTGEPFTIFQDRDDIFIGQQWKTRIDRSLNGSTLLITILTPSFLNSGSCRDEVTTFVDRERRLGRDDLIIPILYIPISGLTELDPVAEELTKRQYYPWGDLRFEDMSSTTMRKGIAELASHVVRALNRSQSDRASIPAVLPTDGDSSDDLGFMELLTEAEEAFPLFTVAIGSLGELISETGAITATTTSELQSTKGSQRPAAARLMIVRRLANRLETPVSHIEAVTEEYLDQLTRVGGGIGALTMIVRHTTMEDNIHAARQLLASLGELAENGEKGIEKIEELRQSLANNYPISSSLRPVLRRMSSALLKIQPSASEFKMWRDNLSEALERNPIGT